MKYQDLPKQEKAILKKRGSVRFFFNVVGNLFTLLATMYLSYMFLTISLSLEYQKTYSFIILLASYISFKGIVSNIVYDIIRIYQKFKFKNEINTYK